MNCEGREGGGMTRWDSRTKKDAEFPGIDIFIEEVLAVCRRHGYSISHEDVHGGFIINGFNEDNADWLRSAAVDI